MKMIFTIVSLFVAFQLGAQEKKEFPKPFEFALVDSVSTTKAELYLRANEWFAKTYTSAHAVIQMNDKESGKIIGKAVIIAPRFFAVRTINERVNYTIAVDIKEGKYRCVLSDFYNDGSDASSSPQGYLNEEKPQTVGQMTVKQWNMTKATTQQQAEALLISLQKSMRSDKNSDF